MLLKSKLKLKGVKCINIKLLNFIIIIIIIIIIILLLLLLLLLLL